MRIFICILLFSGYLQAQTVTVKNLNYTTVFDIQKHYPVCVDWWLTKEKVGCKSERINMFAPDPKLYDETNLVRDYIHSGFDRGHMCNFEDNACLSDEVRRECFYYSNMAPQYHKLNIGSWKSLETLCRHWAGNLDSIHIWAGNIGEQKKIGIMSVPEKCWKVIYIIRQNKYQAWLFVNTKDDSGNKNPETTVENIEQLTGLKFK